MRGPGQEGGCVVVREDCVLLEGMDSATQMQIMGGAKSRVPRENVGKVLKRSGEAVIAVMENHLLISSERKEGNVSSRSNG